METKILYEKYKPKTLDDVVLPEQIRNKLKNYVETQTLPNLGLFSTMPGLGKSSTAQAIINELECEFLWINASIENGIDVLRSKIQRFAAAASFDGKIKVVVMDEFDHFTTAGQAAFRGFIDEFSSNCRFIFTGNYADKIIEPLLNRLEVYDFNSFKKGDTVKNIYSHLENILKQENITHSQNDIVTLITTYYPSIRAMVGAIQNYTVDGVLDVSKIEINDGTFDAVMNYNSYNEMIENVLKLTSPESFYTFLFKNIQKFYKEESYFMVTKSIGEWQATNEYARNKYINLAGLLSAVEQFRRR